MSIHRMRIDLREFPLRPGERGHEVFDLEMAPILLGGQSYEVLLAEGGATLGVERVAGGFLATMSLGATLYGPCVRCLDEVRLHVSAEEKEFVPLRTEDCEEEDLSPFIEDFVVDVAGLAREVLVLGLPAKILCREDCPGLCPTCGCDLVRVSCHCTTDTSDPRWARLKDLDLGR